MPAGVSWGRYLSFCAASMVSMLVGSQIVHRYYRPLDDINLYVVKELKNLPEDLKLKITEELKQEGVIK